MSKRDKDGILRKEKEYVKFVQLLRRAERDGRLDGPYTCKLCGMRFPSPQEADGCCRVTVT